MIGLVHGAAPATACRNLKVYAIDIAVDDRKSDIEISMPARSPSGKIRGMNGEMLLLILTYDELAERLKKHGFSETKASIANKLARSTLTASFFLACLAAMELEGVALDEL